MVRLIAWMGRRLDNPGVPAFQMFFAGDTEVEGLGHLTRCLKVARPAFFVFGNAAGPLSRRLLALFRNGSLQLLLFPLGLSGRERLVVALHQAAVRCSVQQRQIVSFGVGGLHASGGIKLAQLLPFKKSVVAGQFPVGLVSRNRAADDL